MSAEIEVTENVLPVGFEYQPQPAYDWWTEYITGARDPSELTQLSAEKQDRYVRPEWKATWAYDIEKLPSMEEIRSPGVQRAERENPLPNAPDDEFSRLVSRVSIAPNAEVFEIKSSVKIEVIGGLMKDFSNRYYLSSWLKVFREGLWPWADNFEKDRRQMPVYLSPEHLFQQHKKFIHGIRDKEVALGCWRGPFDKLFDYGRNSPWTVAPKSEGGNRFIQDQSHSVPRGDSLNDHIPLHEGKVRYDGLKELALVIVVLKKEGRENMVPWKLDVARAFRHLPLHPLFTLRNAIILRSRKGNQQIYYDAQACFGGRAFPRAYCMFADLIVWIAVMIASVYILLHYVDDHFGISEIDIPGQEPVDMRRTRGVFGQISVPLNEKDEYGDGITIIGVEVRYDKATFEIPQSKLIRYISTCTTLSTKTAISMEDLEHAVGILDYCLTILPRGKVQNAPLYQAKARNYKVRKRDMIPMEIEMKESLRWWSIALATNPTRYLLQDAWWPMSTANEVVFCDASTSRGLGIYRPASKIGYQYEYPRDGWIYRILNIEDRKGALLHVNTMELLGVLSTVQIVKQGIAVTDIKAPFRLVSTLR